MVRLSPDRTRFYVQSANQEHFEVVDVRKRESLDRLHTERPAHAREGGGLRSGSAAQDDDATRPDGDEVDHRWEIGNPEFIVHDLAEHKVLRTIPWAADFEPSNYSRGIPRYSPDGKFLYVFGLPDL